MKTILMTRLFFSKFFLDAQRSLVITITLLHITYTGISIMSPCARALLIGVFRCSCCFRGALCEWCFLAFGAGYVQADSERCRIRPQKSSLERCTP